MNKYPTSPAEIREATELVEKSVATILEQEPIAPRYTYQNSTNALANIHGAEAAVDFTRDFITRKNFTSRIEPFTLWKGIIAAAGNREAIYAAREVIKLDSLLRLPQYPVSQGDIELSVQLVEAGDIDSSQKASYLASNAPTLDRPQLFKRLYRAGNQTALEPALGAAKDIEAYYNQPDRSIRVERAQSALTGIARTAIANGHDEDAATILPHIKRESKIADLRLEQFVKGTQEDVLPFLLEYLKHDENFVAPYMRRFFVQQLALGGHKKSREELEKYVANQTKDIYAPKHSADLGCTLDSLVTLHELGDQSAASKTAEIIKAQQSPESYLDYLGRVSLHALQHSLATKVYNNAPSIANAENLIKVQYSTEAWNTVINHFLKNSPIFAASFTQQLSELVKCARDTK